MRVYNAESKMRKDREDMHQIELDRVTQTTRAQRESASNFHLQQVNPAASYGLRGDPTLYKDASGNYYKNDFDGSVYRYNK